MLNQSHHDFFRLDTAVGKRTDPIIRDNFVHRRSIMFFVGVEPLALDEWKAVVAALRIGLSDR